MLTFVKSVLGISYTRRHIARLGDLNQFPKRVSLGLGSVAWVTSEVEAWIDAKMAAREAKQKRRRQI